MNTRKERNGRMAVPEFGGWDRKSKTTIDYSMVFSQARANKKQQKSDFNSHSLGNEKELLAKQEKLQDDSVMRKKKIVRYLSCCIRP